MGQLASECFSRLLFHLHSSQTSSGLYGLLPGLLSDLEMAFYNCTCSTNKSNLVQKASSDLLLLQPPGMSTQEILRETFPLRNTVCFCLGAWQTIKYALPPWYSPYCGRRSAQPTNFWCPAAKTPTIWAQIGTWQWKKVLTAIFTIQLVSRKLTKSHWFKIISFSSPITSFLISHSQSQILPQKEHFAPTASTGQRFCGWRSSKREPAWATPLFSVFIFKLGRGDGQRGGNASEMWEVLILAFWSSWYDLHMSKWSSVNHSARSCLNFLPGLGQSYITSASRGTQTGGEL